MTLSNAETTLRFSANRDVPGGSELFAEALHRRFARLACSHASGCQLSEAPRGEGSIVVGDAGVGVTVIQRERERRAGVVSKVVGDEMSEHRVALHGIFGGVEVLKERRPKQAPTSSPMAKNSNPPQS